MRHYLSVHLVVPPGGCFRETRRIELGPRVLTIGRGPECDIRLDVPGVDPEHARISDMAMVAMGPDCAVGDVPLDAGNRRLILPGDEVQIGSVVLAIDGEEAAAEESAGLARRRPDGPRVRVVEGQNYGDELLLKEENREYVIGRSPSCDLVLEDREVSRQHVKLMRRGYNVYLLDLSSTRGSWLGRSAVYTGSTIEWERPRMLRVGATVLSLELPEAVRRAAPPVQASAPMTAEPRRAPPMSAAKTADPSGPALPVTIPPPAVASGPVLESGPLPSSVAALPSTRSNTIPPTHARTAWKEHKPTIGKGSGILLLALAGLAILGVLFVVFSLME